MSITCVRTYTVLRRGTRRRTIRTNTGSHHGSVHALTYPRHHHSSPPFCTVRRNAPTRRPPSSSYSRASHAMPCMRDAAAHHHTTTSVARGGADCRRPAVCFKWPGRVVRGIYGGPDRVCVDPTVVVFFCPRLRVWCTRTRTYVQYRRTCVKETNDEYSVLGHCYGCASVPAVVVLNEFFFLCL